MAEFCLDCWNKINMTHDSNTIIRLKLDNF